MSFGTLFMLLSIAWSRPDTIIYQLPRYIENLAKCGMKLHSVEHSHKLKSYNCAISPSVSHLDSLQSSMSLNERIAICLRPRKYTAQRRTSSLHQTQLRDTAFKARLNGLTCLSQIFVFPSLDPIKRGHELGDLQHSLGIVSEVSQQTC